MFQQTLYSLLTPKYILIFMIRIGDLMFKETYNICITEQHEDST